MSTRALIVATVGAATFASVGVLCHAGPLGRAGLAVLCAALFAVALSDLTQRRIPNRIVLPAAATCSALTLAVGTPLSLLAGLATILVVSLRWPAALAMGDVKLALLIVLGLAGDALRALALDLLLAALAGLALVIRHGGTAWRRSLPLAPFLVVGALIAVIA